MNNCLYIFLDESGDFNFSPTGTKYFTLTTISAERNWDDLYLKLSNKIYDLIEFGKSIQYFHCSEDNIHVRKSVFEIIENHLAENSLRIDSIIIEKRKTGYGLQNEKEFYVRMIGYLLGYIFNNSLINDYEHIIVITDNIPINRKRNAVEKAIKSILKEKLNSRNKKFGICHNNSCSHFMLQVVDYCNWAIFKKYESNNVEYYNKIAPFIKSEFDIFANGTNFYY